MKSFSLKDTVLRLWHRLKNWLQSLSFRTGVIVLLCCIPFYILSSRRRRLQTPKNQTQTQNAYSLTYQLNG